jgi:Galactose oxidase, central domain
MRIAPLARWSLVLPLGVLALMLLVSVPIAASVGASPVAPLHTGRAGIPPFHPAQAVPSAAPHPWSCHGLKLLGTSACGGPANEFAPTSIANASPGWTQVDASPPPHALYDFEMTYDTADRYVLLFGAIALGAGTQGPTDMWSYANGSWRSISAAVIPQNCPGSSLAYDDADGYVVYFAAPGCASANQTWAYRAGAWQQLAPTLSPPGRYGASLTNDSADGYLVLFGGQSSQCGNFGVCNDTWTFSAGNWAQRTPTTHPSARAEAGMAYDVADGYVLLFGGTSSAGNLNDTWNFSHGNWTQLHPARSPPAPTPDAFSYSTADKAVVYTTADNTSANLSEVTWTYHAGAWTPVTAIGPIQRLGAATADDPAGGQTLFFGGMGYADLHDSWGLRNGNWTNLTPIAPAPRYYATAAYDGANDRVMLFGGTTYSGCCATPLNDTWVYSSSGWSRLSTPTAPPPRTLASLVFDAADGYMLLFGGYGSSGSLNDSWEFAGGVWTQLTPTVSPPSHWSNQPYAVYDGADGYVVLLLGPEGHMWTWTYKAGVWSNVTRTAGSPPPGPLSNPLAYDSTDGYVILFGTSQTRGLTNLTYTFKGGVWTNLTSTAGAAPPPSSGASLIDFPAGGYVLLFEGTGTNDTWSFSNGSWTERFAPFSPAPRWGMASAYDLASSADVFFGGSGSPECGTSSVCGDTWLWTNAGPNLPYIRGFTATPAITDVGVGTTLRVRAAGGVGVLTYGYAGLPTGCATANRSLLACSPAVSGTFLIQLTVTDSKANVATAAVTLTVNPAPQLASLTANPAAIALGASTVVRATPTGGTPPYSYLYVGLPTGCASQTVPALPCTPAASGNYTINLTLSDALGAVASSTVNLSVSAVGGGGSPLITSFAPVPAALVLGNATNLTVNASAVAGALSYAFTGLPAGCATANVSRLFCRPIASGTYLVWASVSDSTPATTSVATNLTVYPIGGGAGLTVSAFGATPSVLPVNGSTTLVVTASGGTGPIGYDYVGLPPGCLPANRSLLPCRPTVAGDYSIHALVFDGSGQRIGVFTSLKVAPVSSGPGPAISQFLVSPRDVTVGENVTMVVSVTGGTLPLTYSYRGLPSGCANTNTLLVRCAPSTPGNYSIQVTVTDPVGRSTTANAPLSVHAAPILQPRSAGGALSLLASPAVLAGLFAAGVAVVVVLAVLRRRERTRREGRELVRELETYPAETIVDESEP